MQHTLPDGTEIYYEIQGQPAAPRTLVFLNGLSQSTLAWSAIAPSFFKDTRIVLIDLVFQGKSGKPAQFRTYDQHAADVLDLLSALGEKKPVLCGLSYGSAVAQHAVVNHPDFFGGAVLLSTFAHNTALFNAIGESWKSALIAGGYPLMLEVMLPTVLGKSYFEKPLIPIATMKETRVSNNLDTDSLLKLMRATEERGDYRPKLAQVKVPVLVAQGEEDLLIPPSTAQEVAAAIPGARFVIIEKAGHTLNLEAIPQVTKLVRAHLENCFHQ